ncbi:hypothetical protein EAI_07036 [Harpegnathos saltator]|uniref:Uncharacterized protein n=1 Tax=Harpegnathos saltator TaxID=610380 RepID=E2BVE1_HARSA|nr:hypothetical protein EAI_07036 [Harpegnathos saltator]
MYRESDGEEEEEEEQEEEEKKKKKKKKKKKEKREKKKKRKAKNRRRRRRRALARRGRAGTHLPFNTLLPFVFFSLCDTGPLSRHRTPCITAAYSYSCRRGWRPRTAAAFKRAIPKTRLGYSSLVLPAAVSDEDNRSGIIRPAESIHASTAQRQVESVFTGR